MAKKIIITGATGLIGRKISFKLIGRGESVIVFTRNPEKAKSIVKDAAEYVKWDYRNPGDWEEQINGSDTVIHLAGESVIGSRWTEDHKKRVKESRVESTRALVDAIAKSSNRPEAFLVASAIGFYDNSIEGEYDETSEKGEGFLADVVDQWEHEAAGAEKLGVRRVSIRIGIVLDKNEGALAKMLPTFKFFIGGPLGTGKQWFPWVHVDDVAGLFVESVYDQNYSGSLNAAAPEYITMNQFAATLGKVMRRPSLFKVPEFVLKLLLGDAADVVIKGSKIIPRRTLEAGYQFKYVNAEAALSNLLVR